MTGWQGAAACSEVRQLSDELDWPNLASIERAYMIWHAASVALNRTAIGDATVDPYS